MFDETATDTHGSSDDLTRAVVHIYLQLIWLSERHISNVEPCRAMLLDISALYDTAIKHSQNHPPIINLNEYFLYLKDLESIGDAPDRAVHEAQAQKFKSQVQEWIFATAPELKDESK